jgi:hypothetical protein
MFINGYKYDTKEDALAAMERINAHFNIGTSEDNVTKNYVIYNTAELNTPIFYYIVVDDSLIPILGYPSPIEVIIDESPLDVID